MDNLRPRVFISSVVDSFEEFRDAAARAVEKAGCEPLLIERIGGIPSSPRNACLDGVSSCDILVLICGARGGFTAPSGKLVVQEEYEEARRKALPILAFVKDGERDSAAEALLRLVSDYVDGLLRPTFSTPSELEEKIFRSLGELNGPGMISKTNPEIVTKAVNNPAEFSGEASLRVVFIPERDDEVIGTVYIESQEFEDDLYGCAHTGSSRLFSYEARKAKNIGINEINISQSPEEYRADLFERVCLDITTKGMIIIDINVTGSKRSEFGLGDTMVLAEEEITEALEKCFSFAATFLNKVDEYKRYGRLFFNASLGNVSGRELLPKRVEKSSYSVSWDTDKVVLAFDEPKVLTRDDLSRPGEHIEGVLALFRRRLKSRPY